MIMELYIFPGKTEFLRERRRMGVIFLSLLKGWWKRYWQSMIEWNWRNYGIRRMWAVEKVFGGWMWFWKWCRKLLSGEPETKKLFVLCALQTGLLGYSCCCTGGISNLPLCEQTPIGQSGIQPEWLVANVKKISTRLLPCDGWFCPVSSEPVEHIIYKVFADFDFLSGSVKWCGFLRKWCSKWCSENRT